MKRWLILMALCVSVVYAQEEEQLYELVNLGKNVNTRYHESAPIISPDGNTLYFFVSDHPKNKFGREHSQDIWYSEKDENGEWGPAIHMDDPLNNHRYNQVMSVSRDGSTLLIRGGVHQKDGGFSTTHRLGPSKWSKPEALKIKDYQKMDQGRFSGACMSNDSKVLLMYFSERKDYKFSDIYVSFLQANNQWSRPKKIEEPISTYRDEFGPFLAADNKTLYFASNRPGGKGSMDIYKTTRLDDTWLSWSEPENMGSPLNTGGFDAYYSVDASGLNAFTTRAYMSADGGSLDILGIISKPNLVVSGYVRNKDNNQPLEAELEYHTEGIEPHFFVSDENGFYKLLLHDKRNYLLSAFKEGFNDLFDSVDLRNAGQEEEIRKDFYMIPRKPEILLFGLVLDQSNNNPLAADFNYKAQGVGTGSFSSDAEEGYFSVKLPDQGNYYFRVKLEGYKPLQDSMQIVTENYYEELEKNFYLIPEIKLSGYTLNERTSEPLSVSVSFLDPNGKELKINSNQDGYHELILPEEGKYMIRAIKEGFLNLSDSLEVFEYNSDEGLFKELLLIPIEIGVTVRLNNIFFDLDKTTLGTESFPELDRVVELMNQNPTLEIEIAGHTDNSGSDEYNLNLSQGRSEEVRNYIIQQGISENRIVAKGYGETRPEVSNDTVEGRQQNRRVEFTVLSK